MRMVAFAVVAAVAAPAFAQYTTVDFSSQFNMSRGDGLLANGGTFPTGSQNFLGVPFELGTGDTAQPWAWSAYHAVTGGPASLTIPVNQFGIATAYTTINTLWGQPGPDSFLTVTFNGSAGDTATFFLVGNEDIRDYNQNIWTNIINGTTTREVFSNGLGQRLDMQMYELPGIFAFQTLLSVTIEDTGAANFQRGFVSGLTVQVLPAPASAGLFLGALGLGARRRRA